MMIYNVDHTMNYIFYLYCEILENTQNIFCPMQRSICSATSFAAVVSTNDINANGASEVFLNRLIKSSPLTHLSFYFSTSTPALGMH